MAIPASQKAIRRIAMRQGLVFGGIVGALMIVDLVGSALLSLWRPSGLYSYYAFGIFGLVLLAACATFFLAGLRTAKKTGRVEMGALAGFWAAITVSLLGVIAIILQKMTGFEGAYPRAGFFPTNIWDIILMVFYVMGTYLVVALLLGTALGVLGGFIGKAYANDVPPIQSMPPLYMYPSTQSAQPQSIPPQNLG